MQEQNQESDYQIKYFFIGENFVGKTSLSLKFARNQGLQSKQNRSIDTMIKYIKVKDIKVKLQIQDNVKVQTLFNVIKIKNKDPISIILVYDITNRRSFEQIIQYFQIVKQNINKNFRVALIGNKLDLEAHRQVTRIQAQKLIAIIRQVVQQDKISKNLFIIQPRVSQKVKFIKRIKVLSKRKILYKKKKNQKLVNLKNLRTNLSTQFHILLNKDFDFKLQNNDYFLNFQRPLPKFCEIRKYISKISVGVFFHLLGPFNFC